MDFEIKIIEFLQGGRNTFFNTTFKLITELGSIIGVVVIFLMFFVKDRKLAFWYILSYGISALLVWVLKDQITRPRPYNASDTILCLDKMVTDFSFPSGHCACATAIAIFVGYALWNSYTKRSTRIWIVLGCTLYVMLVGLSRMYLGMHYLTDVVAGVCVSIFFCSIGLILMRFIEKQKKVNYEDKNGSKKS